MPSVRFRLNGAEMDVEADPDRSLLDILRGPLGMTGPHFGCGAGECGACNVIIGDRAVAAPLVQVSGNAANASWRSHSADNMAARRIS